MPNHSRAPVRVNPVLPHPAEERRSLSGEWRFRLDPKDEGLQKRWLADPDPMTESIQVPGCWQGQGFGGDEKEKVWDFRFWARTFRATYTGTGWYGKTFNVPDEWGAKRIWLNFGGVHPSAEVWLNGVRLGENHAPFVPFGFEVTEVVASDKENVVVVRVHEEDRELGFAYSWQGNWSGLYRDVELTATGTSFLERLWIHPDVDEQCLRIRARIGGFDASVDRTLLQVSAGRAEQNAPTAQTEQLVSAEDVAFDVPVSGPDLWSPDAPNLYRVDAALVRGEEVLDAVSERVGFVKLSTEGKHYLINNDPYYMRGTGDFLAHPETGCPDTDRERWRRKLKALREYGYNYVRCQSYVPAPEYLDAADEVGLLAQSEMGMLGAWSGSSPWHVYQWPQPTPGYRERLKGQWDQVVMRDVNHPSANIYCMSNELGTRNHHPRIAWQCYHDTKAIKPSAMVIWTDGGYRDDAPQDFVNAAAEVDQECDKPVIQHEFRWWSSYPDVRIMQKYSGALRPYAQDVALEAAKQHGIEHVLPLAAENSQRLQLLEAKGKMEICRLDNERLAGICHFNAMDTSPSPQGILDEFYERKVADAQTWQQTNGDTVILSSLGFDDRVLAAGDTLRCDLFVSDFSHPPLESPQIHWKLVTDDAELASGEIRYPHKPYCTCPAGALEVAIGEVTTPVKGRLQAKLAEEKRTSTNQWDFWLFPDQADPPESLAMYGDGKYTWLRTVEGVPTVSPNDLADSGKFQVVAAERLDEALVAFTRAGGRTLLAASEGLVRPFAPKFGHTLGHYFFTPPANYPPYEDGHDGTIVSAHPMLGQFPHEGFADLQWFRMITDSPPIELEPLGLNEADPVIRVMHSYPVGRSLGYVVEYSVGKGGLILCALELDQSLVEARYLFAQICRYAASDDFAPALALTETALAKIVAGTALP